MNRRHLTAAVSTSAMLVTAGCATVESTAAAPTEQAKSFTIPIACASAREALQPALSDLKFEVKTTHDSGDCDRDVVAAKGISAFSWGELVRVTLREGDANSTILAVTTKRRDAINITAKGDWSQEVYAAVLKHAKAGN